MDLHCFFTDLVGFGFGKDFNDSVAWMPGNLWRAVAACGGLWRAVAESCGPYILSCSVLGACRLPGWLDVWMEGWPDGLMEVVGITTVT